MGVGSRF